RPFPRPGAQGTAGHKERRSRRRRCLKVAGNLFFCGRFWNFSARRAWSESETRRELEIIRRCLNAETILSVTVACRGHRPDRRRYEHGRKPEGKTEREGREREKIEWLRGWRKAVFHASAGCGRGKLSGRLPGRGHARSDERTRPRRRARRDRH